MTKQIIVVLYIRIFNKRFFNKRFYLHGLICNSYTMGTSGLPDIYTQGPRAEGVYIRQIMSAHGITNIYQF